MTTLSVAPAPARSHGRGRHRAGRRPSHAAIELRRTWRPRRTLGDLLATATEHYCMHVVLWAALFVVFVIALYLDGAAASGAAALGTGFFRRRRTDAEQPAAQPPAGEQQPPREDPLAEPDDGLGVPELAGPDEEPPAERTDVIRAVRRDPTPSNPGANPLARIAELERQLADRDRVIARGREQLRDLEARLRNEQFDREEADRAAAVLRRALDETRPAPDAAELGARLKHVYLLPVHPESADVRWRRVAQAAIDAVRGTWPIDRWPLDAVEREQWAAEEQQQARAVEQAIDDMARTQLRAALEQNRAAELVDTLPSPPGGGAAAVSPPAAGAAPGDPTAEDVALAESALYSLPKLIAQRDLDITGGSWDRLSDVMREHYRMVAADVVAGGWRPPAREWKVGDLAACIAAHEDLPDGACRCGWAGEVIFHAEHVAEILLAAGVTR